MRHHRLTASTFLIAAALAIPVYGDGIDDFYETAMSELNAFNDKNQSEFDAFCEKIDRQMADFMSNPWKQIKKEKPIPKPIEPEPVVIIYDEESDTVKDKDIPPVTINRTVKPRPPKPQPVPPAPLPTPSPSVNNTPPLALTFYGTALQGKGFKAPGLGVIAQKADEASVRNAFEQLSQTQSAQLLSSLLRWRSDLSLPDWGYAMLVQAVSEKYYGKDTNASRLFQGFLLQRSGYDIRFARSGNRLIPMAAVDGGIYDKSYLTIDGKRYYMLHNSAGDVYVCNFKYPGEKRMSLDFHGIPTLDYSPGNERRVQVHNHPELTLTLNTNKNLIDFYNDYPTGWLGDDQYTRWTIYADVPASEQMRQDIYPRLRQALQGKNQYEAVGILLKVAQSFPYEYDDKIWGGDRAFFPDESWHYSHSDCEDHAIHFSRLVRDIVNLDVCLVYYPGHLSAAVAFTDGSASGESVMHNGRKYTFCDATYFYADIGKQAPSNVNAEKILIETQK